jgi:hypothetical protein
MVFILHLKAKSLNHRLLWLMIRWLKYTKEKEGVGSFEETCFYMQTFPKIFPLGSSTDFCIPLFHHI